MSKRDPARSYETLDDDDLARLGRVADADVEAFFARNPYLHSRRDRLVLVALAQGAAEHRLRGERGIWDLDPHRLLRQEADTTASNAPPSSLLGLGTLEVRPLPLRPTRLHRPRR
jgi:hypothetical protein